MKFPLHFLRGLAALFFLSASGSVPLTADQIVSIEESGVLRLQDGRQVTLAGLELDPDSFMVLSVVLAGREVEVKKDKKLPAAEDGILPVYLFVQTAEMPMPFSANVSKTEKKVMLNEMLLSLGAAKVPVAAPDFEYRERFLKLEKEARERGAGLWSYARGAKG